MAHKSTRDRLEGTESAANALKRVHYTHDAMIDMIVECPDISQDMLAANFGFTVPWVSRVINSDAFQATLAKRKQELIDPALVASIEERLRETATKSLDVVLNKLNGSPSFDQAIKAVEVTTKCLGYGQRKESQTNIQTNFVVKLPDKSPDADTWADTYSPEKLVKEINNGSK